MTRDVPSARSAAASLWSALLAITVCVTTAAADLGADIEAALRATRLSGATVAVSIRDADTDAALYSYNARTPMIPASNMKLLTTGAALYALGPDFRFETDLRLDGERLVLVGDGDPALADPELLDLMTDADGAPISVDDFVDYWVDPTRERTATVNELIIDDRVFDRTFVHPTWPKDQLNRRYCAQVAGLNFHLNVVHFYPRPSSGRPDLQRYEPRFARNALSVRNRATSHRRRTDRNDVWIARPPESNQLTFYNNVKTAYQVAVPVTLHDVPDLLGDMLHERLEQAGVDVGRVRRATPEEPPFGGELVRRIATPLSTVLTRCNRDSQNLYAESMLKRIAHERTGQPGSWRSGGAAMRQVISDVLGDPSLLSPVVVADGSGMSRSNRVTAAMLTKWINVIARDAERGAMFMDSLAVGGSSGTLRKRFRDVELSGATVQAKSGFINHVSCLTGFVVMPDGRRRAFSVLVNDMQNADVRKAKKLQEEIAAVVARDLAATPAPVSLGSD